jgi:hypothetical protein
VERRSPAPREIARPPVERAEGAFVVRPRWTRPSLGAAAQSISADLRSGAPAKRAARAARARPWSRASPAGRPGEQRRAERTGTGDAADERPASGFSGMWPPDVDGSAIIAAVRDGWGRIRPFSTGGNYVNFQLAEDGPERTKEAYRENLLRLQRIKAEVDPNNLFRVNRNISPAR